MLEQAWRSWRDTLVTTRSTRCGCRDATNGILAKANRNQTKGLTRNHHGFVRSTSMKRHNCNTVIGITPKNLRNVCKYNYVKYLKYKNITWQWCTDHSLNILLMTLTVVPQPTTVCVYGIVQVSCCCSLIRSRRVEWLPGETDETCSKTSKYDLK